MFDLNWYSNRSDCGGDCGGDCGSDSGADSGAVCSTSY